jgi:hypothetical protein
MENVSSFYDHLEYFTAIWNNLLPFGIVCGHLVYFSRFGMFERRKIWQPCTPGRCHRLSLECSWGCSHALRMHRRIKKSFAAGTETSQRHCCIGRPTAKSGPRSHFLMAQSGRLFYCCKLQLENYKNLSCLCYIMYVSVFRVASLGNHQTFYDFVFKLSI